MPDEDTEQESVATITRQYLPEDGVIRVKITLTEKGKQAIHSTIIKKLKPSPYAYYRPLTEDEIKKGNERLESTLLAENGQRYKIPSDVRHNIDSTEPTLNRLFDKKLIDESTTEYELYYERLNDAQLEQLVESFKYLIKRAGELNNEAKREILVKAKKVKTNHSNQTTTSEGMEWLSG